MEKEEIKIYTDVDDLLKDLLNFKCVIYTPTETEAKEFVKIMKDKYDFCWKDKSYKTLYECFKKGICYDFEFGKNDMYCGDLINYKSINKYIVPYFQIRHLLFTSLN